MTSCCCCCFCGPLPNSPHSLMWDQLHIQLDNNCNFQSQEIGIRRGSCSDSWLYLSFCLLIDAFFISGTFQTLAEKFLVSPEGTTLSNRISLGSRAARFEKRNAHTLAGILALYNFSLWYPEDTHQTSQEFLFLKKWISASALHCLTPSEQHVPKINTAFALGGSLFWEHARCFGNAILFGYYATQYEPPTYK